MSHACSKSRYIKMASSNESLILISHLRLHVPKIQDPEGSLLPFSSPVTLSSEEVRMLREKVLILACVALKGFQGCDPKYLQKYLPETMTRSNIVKDLMTQFMSTDCSTDGRSCPTDKLWKILRSLGYLKVHCLSFRRMEIIQSLTSRRKLDLCIMEGEPMNAVEPNS